MKKLFNHSSLLPFVAFSALGSFIVCLLLYGLKTIWPDVPISDKFIPSTLFGALGPPLTILLFYELILLGLSFKHSLVECVRRQFEVLSLILLRDVFKEVDLLVSGSDYSNTVLIEIAITAFGAVSLYFVIELLERFQKNYDMMTADNTVAKFAAIKRAISVFSVITMTGITLAFTIRWLTLEDASSIGDQYLTASLSFIAICNSILLFVSIQFVKGYENLFEYSALVLASLVGVLSLSLDPLARVLTLILSSLFVLLTLVLHGFARGKKPLRTLLKTK